MKVKPEADLPGLIFLLIDGLHLGPQNWLQRLFQNVLELAGQFIHLNTIHDKTLLFSDQTILNKSVRTLLTRTGSMSVFLRMTAAPTLLSLEDALLSLRDRRLDSPCSHFRSPCRHAQPQRVTRVL